MPSPYLPLLDSTQTAHSPYILTWSVFQLYLLPWSPSDVRTNRQKYVYIENNTEMWRCNMYYTKENPKEHKPNFGEFAVFYEFPTLQNSGKISRFSQLLSWNAWITTRTKTFLIIAFLLLKHSILPDVSSCPKHMPCLSFALASSATVYLFNIVAHQEIGIRNKLTDIRDIYIDFMNNLKYTTWTSRMLLPHYLIIL